MLLARKLQGRQGELRGGRGCGRLWGAEPSGAASAAQCHSGIRRSSIVLRRDRHQTDTRPETRRSLGRGATRHVDIPEAIAYDNTTVSAVACGSSVASPVRERMEDPVRRGRSNVGQHEKSCCTELELHAEDWRRQPATPPRAHSPAKQLRPHLASDADPPR